MSINTQSESVFFTRLPREIRDAIYLELWGSCGRRQHIVHHGIPADRHFCRWSCSTEYEVQDRRQREIEELRRRLGVALGQEMTGEHDPEVKSYARRLQSPWMNHWACGERAARAYGPEPVRNFATHGLGCWKQSRPDNQRPPSRSPYLPMLLSCKLMSQECTQSIYESTTFVFTDMPTIQRFIGYCRPHPAMKTWPRISIPPPGFFEYARILELSLSPDFPALVLCAAFDLPGIENRHDVYDFHWLRLDQFQSLRTLNIWISALSTTWSLEDGVQTYDFTGITEFDIDALRKALAPLEGVASVTVSTPLGLDAGPEDGYVTGACASARVYRRGAGDRYHPTLFVFGPERPFMDIIYTSLSREVHLSCNGGNWLVMRGAQ